MNKHKYDWDKLFKDWYADTRFLPALNKKKKQVGWFKSPQVRVCFGIEVSDCKELEWLTKCDKKVQESLIKYIKNKAQPEIDAKKAFIESKLNELGEVIE